MSNDMLQNIFKIVFAMMISLVLFWVVFGDTGKIFIWSDLEPVLTGQWSSLTFDDGVELGEVRSKPFDSAQDLSVQ